MKKILVVLAAITLVLTINTPVAFATRQIIPFWQNGGSVTTLISVTSNDGTGAMGTFTSTGATVTITLYSTDTASGYTISSTGAGAGGSVGTAGLTFATATYQATKGTNMIVDTAQIGSSFATVIWSTGIAPGFHATNAKFGYGIIDTGTANPSEFRGWVAVYGGSQPAGFTVAINGGATF
ncbi:MAG: hypothetical protein HY578_06555 [Nitrospinae bacterium]|nr:hypothetical protein [Nitrospinota bacterium]